VGFHVGDNSDDLAPLGGAAAHIQANLFSKRLVTKQVALQQTLRLPRPPAAL